MKENVKKVLQLAAEGVNVAYAIMHGGGIIQALALTDEVSAMKGLDVKALLEEIKTASEEERKEHLEMFKAKLSIADKKLEEKIESGMEAFQEVIELGLEGVGIYEKGVALVEKVKVIVA